ncbi:MAG: RHS repeat-associated core domain-containing protein [Oscillospiraceae bacterium]|jgi:RHS repeat-associated protein
MKKILLVLIALSIIVLSIPFSRAEALSVHAESRKIPERSMSPKSSDSHPSQTYPIESPDNLYPIDFPQTEGGFLLTEPTTFESAPLFEPSNPDPPVAQATINIGFEPAIYIPNVDITLSWNIEHLDLDPSSTYILRIHLPPYLEPASGGQYNMLPAGTLDIPLTQTSGTVDLKNTENQENLDETISILAELLVDNRSMTSKFAGLPSKGYTLTELQQISQNASQPPLVALFAEDESDFSELLFSVHFPQTQNEPIYELSTPAIEVLAVDSVTGENVETFDEQIEITYSYNRFNWEGKDIQSLQLLRYDAEIEGWIPLESEVDADSQFVKTKTDRVGIFNIDPSNWQAHLPPLLESYDISPFTGAFSYQYPIQTFAGPGGLKPSLNLIYNSQTVDQSHFGSSALYKQASWVGMGWTLDTGYITRDNNNTNSNPDDDTFYINLSGISGRLLPIHRPNSDSDLWEYVLQDNPSEHVYYEPVNNFWFLFSGDGLIYTFGGPNATARLGGSSCATDEGGLKLPWKWGLIRVENQFGQSINYTYVLDRKGWSFRDYFQDNSFYCYNHIDIYPKQITYGSFKITFNVSGRHEYRPEWTHYRAQVNYSRVRLDSIDLYVNNAKVKSYILKYAGNYEGFNIVSPEHYWAHNSKTNTLIFIQEQGHWANGETQNLNPVQFVHEDQKHIKLINNGYQGAVRIEYFKFKHNLYRNSRFVVVKRQNIDLTSNTVGTWTYQYPPEGFKMGTDIDQGSQNSNPYTPAYQDFRGFATVYMIQHNTNDTPPLQTKYEFDQSYTLKGRLLNQTVSSNNLCYSKTSNVYQNEILLPNTSLAVEALRQYTDLNINWQRLVSSTQYSYDGANCDNLETEPHIATRASYQYPDLNTAWVNRQLNPTQINGEVFDGYSWYSQPSQLTERLTSRFFQVGDRHYYVNQIVKREAVQVGNEVVRETIYEHHPNFLLKSKAVWSSGTSTNKLYNFEAYVWNAQGQLHQSKVWQEYTDNPYCLECRGTPTAITTYNYDATFPTQVAQQSIQTNGKTYTTQISYHSRLGLPTVQTDFNGVTSETSYDALGRIISYRAPGEAHPTLVAHYYLNGSIEESDPHVRIQQQGMADLRISYNGFGQIKKETVLGAEIEGTPTNWVSKETKYDTLGRPEIEINAGLARKTEYDALGRVRLVERIAGTSFTPEQSYSYSLQSQDIDGINQFGWLKSVTDSNGNTHTSFTDAKGHVLYNAPPSGTGPAVKFEYDVLGQLIETNYGGAISSIEYNVAGQKISMNDADMGLWTYRYDALGNLISQTDARGQTIALSYDGLNRLVGKSFYIDDVPNEPPITYTYDEGIGQLGYRTRMTDASGETHWTYDARGRMTSESKTILDLGIYTTQWQYDSQDRITSMTYPDGEVLYYSYLPQGGIKTVNSNRASLLTNTLVDGHGRIRQSTYADKNGDTDSPYIKNVYYHAWLGDAGRLSAMSASRTTATDSAWYLGLGLNYDGVGNITSLQDNMNGDGIEKQVQTFTYDALNRLVTASTSDVGEGQYSQSYGYDPNTGNLSYKSDIGAYSYDASRPHAVMYAGSYAFMYDANGNVTHRTPFIGLPDYHYIYNAENKIIEIKKGGVTTRKFVYDGDGNRVVEELHEGFIPGQEEKTVFISNYYEETIRGTSDSIQSLPDSPYKMYFPFVGGPDQLYARSYYYADGERIAMRHGQSYYYVFGDHLGSTTSIVERNTGRRVNYQLYHPWGTTRYSSGEQATDYGYTGQMQVDDIYYYNARWYDPTLGRFMQADTIVPPHQGTQGFDRYAYVNNNPMRYTDPTGHCATNPYDQYEDYSCHKLANDLSNYFADESTSKSYKEYALLDETELRKIYMETSLPFEQVQKFTYRQLLLVQDGIITDLEALERIINFAEAEGGDRQNGAILMGAAFYRQELSLFNIPDYSYKHLKRDDEGDFGISGFSEKYYGVSTNTNQLEHFFGFAAIGAKTLNVIAKAGAWFHDRGADPGSRADRKLGYLAIKWVKNPNYETSLLIKELRGIQ